MSVATRRLVDSFLMLVSFESVMMIAEGLKATTAAFGQSVNGERRPGKLARLKKTYWPISDAVAARKSDPLQFLVFTNESNTVVKTSKSENG